CIELKCTTEALGAGCLSLRRGARDKSKQKDKSDNQILEIPFHAAHHSSAYSCPRRARKPTISEVLFRELHAYKLEREEGHECASAFLPAQVDLEAGCVYQMVLPRLRADVYSKTHDDIFRNLYIRRRVGTVETRRLAVVFHAHRQAL